MERREKEMKNTRKREEINEDVERKSRTQKQGEQRVRKTYRRRRQEKAEDRSREEGTERRKRERRADVQRELHIEKSSLQFYQIFKAMYIRSFICFRGNTWASLSCKCIGMCIQRKPTRNNKGASRKHDEITCDSYMAIMRD